MKIFFVLVAVAIVLASGFELKFEEANHDYKEKITVDVRKNLEKIEVPAHNGLNASALLNDFNVGYSAIRIDAEQICYVSSIERGLYKSPKSMEADLQKSNGQFPSENYQVKQFKVIPLRKLSPSEVGENIAVHCRGYEMILTMNVNKRDVQAEIRSLVTGQLSEKAKRQVVTISTISLDNACRQTKEESRRNILQCPQTVFPRCKFNRSNCNYVIDCNLDEHVQAWVCSGTHLLRDVLVCCEYYCS